MNMARNLNPAAVSMGNGCISSGKVNKSAGWSFSAADGNKLLGPKGDDWANYGKHFMAVNTDQPEGTKQRYSYPFAKDGTVYRAGVIAAKQRAAAEGDTAIANAADAMMTKMDKMKGGDMMKAADLGALEFKLAACEYKFNSSEPDGTFEGYGSVFNNEDENNDVILPGSFTKTLSDATAASQMPKMFLNHAGVPLGTTTAQDLIPIGVWQNMNEDRTGLAVKGRLINLDTDLGKRIYGAMKEGAMDGLSIGYKAQTFTRGRSASEPKRTISQAKLFECSVVFSGANPHARVLQVKSSGIAMWPVADLATALHEALARERLDGEEFDAYKARHLEALLRDAGGLSRAQAKGIIAAGFKALSPNHQRDAGLQTAFDGLQAALRRVRAIA